VGGHIARTFASAGYSVRGLTRRTPIVAPGDPPIEWLIGDLRDSGTVARATDGMRGVVHAASWVSLGSDRRNESHTVNVDGTRRLLDSGHRAGAERFVFTSTLWTAAAGTADAPADEETPWNLPQLRSPYCDTKREAEAMVRAANGNGFRTTSIIPGLVIGPRDTRPTSTRLLLEMAKTPVAVLPRGGIPVVDARVLALAHLRAFERGQPGGRYIVAGPYRSYAALAAEVARVAGWPMRVVSLPDGLEQPLTRLTRWLDQRGWVRNPNLSPATVAGGFLQLHVTSARADTEFELTHPPPCESIFDALKDHRDSGRARWLKLRPVNGESV
jgi:dihydroflavonol-4-reductase